MATNFKFTRGESKQHKTKEYTIESEYKKEARKVAALEKELKKHEKTDMAHAHPPGHMKPVKNQRLCLT